MTVEELLSNPEGIKSLDEDCFLTAYNMLESFERPKLTRLLQQEGVDPLPYMGVIPSHFMDQSFIWVSIPESIKQINQEAFIQCKNIINVNFSEGLTRIGMLAFSDCSTIQTLDFPKSLEVIDQWAFTGCADLTEVHFNKDNLRYISNYAFGECARLEYITYTGTIEEWRAIDIAGDAFRGAGTKNVRCIDGILSIYEDDDK